eukprot:m.15600 g.15600  ORF g.15600 m.15600 type:complete len:74 (-) comp4497_c0_seq3:137-358(-)
MIHTPSTLRTKLEDTSREATYIGFDHTAMASRFVILATNSIVTSTHFRPIARDVHGQHTSETNSNKQLITASC